MKVLFLSSGNSVNGISSPVWNQGQSLKKKEITVEYFTIRGKGLRSYLRHIFRLSKYLKSNKFDIIHAHYGLCGIVALLASRKEKLVVSFMGDDILGTNLQDGDQKLIGRFLVHLNIFLSKKFYNYSIVKSEQMFNIFGEHINLCICPNGVNLTEFHPVEKSMAIQKTEYPSLAVNVIFVSDPTRPEKNYLLAREAISLLNDDSIILHTVMNVPNNLLRFHYSAADILIMTSFHEGSPNVIKEAMASNCPIVSTDVGDVREIFGATPGCYLSTFEQNDVAEKIHQALDFSRSFGRTEGRQRIIELGLDSETVAVKILDVYKKVLKN
jgi:teichuronic acid biosynthesis glycosyltransferase TuaC